MNNLYMIHNGELIKFDTQSTNADLLLESKYGLRFKNGIN